jgi:hypothetical protein
MAYPGTLIAFSPGTVIRSADANSNNDALRNSLLTAVLKDTAATITVGHTISADPGLIFSAAVSRIVPGATSFSHRNAANTADNLIVLDNGDATFRTKATMPGPLVLTTAVSKIIPGATSISLRNAADSADNLLLFDGGAMTLRDTVVLNKAANGDLLDLQLAAFTKVKLRTFSGTGRIDIDGAQVLRATRTGWATATGTATRTTFDTATVTLPLLAERMKALIDDLHITAGHGLIGT